MKYRRTDGFTLIELLIVVAIIGILAAIAVPNFLNAQTRARVAKAEAELKTLGNAINIYLMDNNNRIIPDYNDGAGVKEGGVGNGVPISFIAAPNSNPSTSYHSLHAWSKLTTPISYTNSIPDDPFWRGLVYGYDGQKDLLPGFSVEKIHNWIIWSIGPDRIDGQWGRGPGAVYYMPSNGLNSSGDITLTPNYSRQYNQGQVRNY
ncbi:MAG: prepilin-type N-terminal cleavage/methylation domain-containing protein [bacterium]